MPAILPITGSRSYRSLISLTPTSILKSSSIISVILIAYSVTSGEQFVNVLCLLVLTLKPLVLWNALVFSGFENFIMLGTSVPSVMPKSVLKALLSTLLKSRWPLSAYSSAYFLAISLLRVSIAARPLPPFCLIFHVICYMSFKRLFSSFSFVSSAISTRPPGSTFFYGSETLSKSKTASFYSLERRDSTF